MRWMTWRATSAWPYPAGASDIAAATARSKPLRRMHCSSQNVLPPSRVLHSSTFRLDVSIL